MKASFPISYEILPGRDNRLCGRSQSDGYHPGIMSDMRPQIFSDLISENDWAAKVKRFNGDLHSFWKGGNFMRSICTFCSHIPPIQCLPFLTAPCIICFFDEEGSPHTGPFSSCICFRNRLRKNALLELQPLCDQLSDDKLVWSLNWADDDPDLSSPTLVNRAGVPVVTGHGPQTSTTLSSDVSYDTTYLYCGEMFNSGTNECSSISRRQW